MDFSKMTREEVYAGMDDEDSPITAEVERLVRQFAHVMAEGRDPHEIMSPNAPAIEEIALETVAVAISDQSDYVD